MPTSDDLMRIARQCADRISPPRKPHQFPSFAEVEEQCGDEYEDLLGVLHEDEVYQPADLDEQERLVEAIRTALPESQRPLLEQLVDNQAAQVWLQQEGAFHLGMAVGVRLAEGGSRILDDDERADLAAEEDDERDPAFGPGRDGWQYEDEDDEDEDDRN